MSHMNLNDNMWRTVFYETANQIFLIKDLSSMGLNEREKNN